MNIRDVDLNLLVIFRSLMTTLSVSRTAEQMSLSQPAVSHALNRLRQDLRDDLLVRSSRAMVATPFANELKPRLDEVLSQLEGILERKAFDPAEAQGRVHIQSTEYFEQLVLPKLLSCLGVEAPGIQIVSTATRGRLPKSELADGTCEVAIAGFFGQLPEGFFQQEIFSDHMVCLCSKDHPSAKAKKISLSDYLKLKHVYISPEGRLGEGVVDELLAKQKKKRQVVASIAGFGGPAWICTNAQYGCTLPQKLAALYTEILPLKWFELPFEAPAIRVVQVWHERTQRDPLFRYIRSTVHKVCERL
jgi:DNA-binding transcriptional LysR family regulator